MRFLSFFETLAAAAVGSPEARCSAAPARKRFWGLIKSHGYHDFELEKHRPWGPPSWHKYEVWIRCKFCGVTIRRFGVDERTINAIKDEPHSAAGIEL